MIGIIGYMQVGIYGEDDRAGEDEAAALGGEVVA